MEWISFHGPRRPINGQKIIYYGEAIGVWRWEYVYSPNDPVSPHIMHCHESPGVVDRMDAPWWMPDVGQEKPRPPNEPYPKDYPNYENIK